MSGGVLYQHCCSYCLKETGKKFDHPLSKCLRNKSNQGMNKTDSTTSNKRAESLTNFIIDNLIVCNISKITVYSCQEVKVGFNPVTFLIKVYRKYQ